MQPAALTCCAGCELQFQGTFLLSVSLESLKEDQQTFGFKFSKKIKQRQTYPRNYF